MEVSNRPRSGFGSGTLIDGEGRKGSGVELIDGWCRVTRSECVEGRISKAEYSGDRPLSNYYSDDSCNSY